MKPRINITGNDLLNRIQFSYAKDSNAQSEPITTADLLSGNARIFKTMSERPAQVWLGDPNQNRATLSPRDLVYAKSRFAGQFLDASESVFNVMEQELAKSRPVTNLDQREAFSRTILDDNLCRLRALYYDLQRPGGKPDGITPEDHKRGIANYMDSLAKECREYVMEVSKMQPGTNLRSVLSPSELETVQNFNHMQRVMGTVFQLNPENSEIFWNAEIAPTQSLDDSEKGGGMNKVFGTLSYTGTNRALYIRYMPYYVLTMHAPMFKQAMSRPKQLAANTTRPGPHKVPSVLAERKGIPADVELTYHSISRYGISNQKDNAVGQVPMRFYYSYQHAGVTKVLEMNRAEHEHIQLQNRPAMVIPPNTFRNPEAKESRYVHFDRAKGYCYSVDDSRIYLTQQQHQKILRHNAQLLGDKMNDPNSPVHFSTDGELSSVMNKIFNENSVRAVSNDSQMWELVPRGYNDKMQLMTELQGILKPIFTREQDKVQGLRDGLFQEFVENKISKAELEDRCRKAAVQGFREMARERRMGIPTEIGKTFIKEATKVIDEAFDEMYNKKSNLFARVAAARYVYGAKISPFYDAIAAEHAKHQGREIDPLRVIDNLPEENKKLFDSYLADVQEAIKGPKGLRNQLKAVFWGAAAQNLMDHNYGPEGIINEGKYIGREGLPKNSAEFLAYVDNHALELHADPIQVGTRLKKAFSYFQYHVSPNYKLPWPNLFRDNKFLEKQREVAARTRSQAVHDSKPEEAPVTLSLRVGDQQVRLNGEESRDATNQQSPDQKYFYKKASPRPAAPKVEAQPEVDASPSLV